jgi:DGQHR domain-containing protein
VAEKAYVFSIINSKQTPVSKSLIYDLFGLAKDRSPYSVSHEIARAMNTDAQGPFYRGIKMLGKKQHPYEILTQGSFVKYLLQLITNKPDRDAIALKSSEVLVERDRPFNAFFRKEKDELILMAMTNYFGAVADAFPKDWAISSYIHADGSPVKGKTPVLRRTVGYEALMRALAKIWPIVQSKGTLEKALFDELVGKFKANIGDQDISTEFFGSSSADAGKLVALMTKEIVT